MLPHQQDASLIVSPLLRLSAELRNNICRYLLGDRKVYISETWKTSITPEMRAVSLHADTRNLLRWLLNFSVDCQHAISTVKPLSL
jgi:hypothetical protein